MFTVDVKHQQQPLKWAWNLEHTTLQQIYFFPKLKMNEVKSFFNSDEIIPVKQKLSNYMDT